MKTSGWKGRSKACLFTDDMILGVQKIPRSLLKAIGAINEFIRLQEKRSLYKNQLLFLYTCSEQSGSKIQKEFHS